VGKNITPALMRAGLGSNQLTAILLRPELELKSFGSQKLRQLLL